MVLNREEDEALGVELEQRLLAIDVKFALVLRDRLLGLQQAVKERRKVGR